MRAILLIAGAVLVHAGEVTTQDLDYRHGEVALHGAVFRPTAPPAGPLAGVLVVHDWMGCSDYAKRRARELAERGHVAVALDMYGSVAKGAAEAKQRAGAFYADPALMIARARAGLDQLRAQPGVDAKRIGAIGFCFGGSVVLHLARAGEPIAGVVSFHGGLKTTTPAQAATLNAAVLVLHGGSDPHVPPADVAAFMQEMVAAKARWRFEVYGPAVHSFTKPEAGNDPSKGSAYDADAERRSFAAMDGFFAEVLKARE